MPRKFGKGITARIRNAQNSTMNDTVNLLRVTDERDDYGAPIDGVTGTYPLNVGLDFTNGTVRQRDGSVVLVEYDAVMRVDATQTILQNDLVQVVDKADITGSFSAYYSIFGSPENLSSSVNKILLKKVS